MKTHIKNIALALTLLFGCLGVPKLQAQTDYNLTVKAGPLRQSFEGFGVCSIFNWGTYDPTLRAQAADMVYRDLKMNVMRFWAPAATGTGANPTLNSVADMLSAFNTYYISTGFIDDVKGRGISTLLLAPCGTFYPPASLTDYANNIAELILQLKTTYDIQFDVTGIANEPGMWSAAQVTQCVIALRSALDSRGLTAVKIIAPESDGSNRDNSGMFQIDGMFASGTAWNSIYGIASHSYGPLQDHEFEDRKLDKQWWITEAAAAGLPWPEWAEDENYAAWISEIFLGNMNHGVTEWLHFNGPNQVADFYTKPGDPSHLVEIDVKTKTLIPYLQYYYFKQALTVFDRDAIFRKCMSATEGDMFRIATTAQNPAINASAAYNPDGSWGINIINCTGVSGTTIATSNNLFYAETAFNVNLTVEELASTPSMSFTIYRSRANNHCVASGTVTLTNGVGSFAIAPRELVSLRSGSSASAIPPVPTGLNASTISAPVALSWNNTVKAASWNIKRATTNGGPYTTIATTSTTNYDDNAAVNGTVYYYVVSAVNSVGESANSNQVVISPAPYPWTNADVGTVGATGSCTAFDDGSFKTYGAGADIGGTADSFNFTYLPMSGDGTIIARLNSAILSNATMAKIGIMMRETLDAGSKEAFVMHDFHWAYNCARMEARATTGANPSWASATSLTAVPTWLRLVRSGNTFTGYASADGTTWTTLMSSTVSMNNNIYVGLADCSVNVGQLCPALIDNIMAPCVAPTQPTEQVVSGTVKLGWTACYGAASYNVKQATTNGGPYTTLGTVTSPTISYTNTGISSGSNYYYVVSAVNACGESANSAEYKAWLSANIGTVGINGSCAISATGTFNTYGSGADIGGMADACNLTYRIMTGDGTIIARLQSADTSHAGMAKVGVMMRETLDAGSKEAFVMHDFHYLLNYARMNARTATGTNPSWVSAPSLTTVPVWLKLVRAGNVFTGYASADGTTWTTLGSYTIVMNSAIYVGLASDSSNTTYLCPAVIDSVTAP